MEIISSLLAELSMLAIPLNCPGCGARDTRLCTDCLAWLAGPMRRVEHSVPRLDNLTGQPLMPVWALGDYLGSARGTIVAWKDRGREDLTRILCDALTLELAANRRDPELAWPAVDLVIPMPSSPASSE